MYVYSLDAKSNDRLGASTIAQAMQQYGAKHSSRNPAEAAHDKTAKALMQQHQELKGIKENSGKGDKGDKGLDVCG